MSFLKIENLSKRFGDLWAVRDVSFEIERGELFGLLGKSGSGKTTTLRMIAGLEKPSSGKILLDGANVTDLAPEKRGFGLVFQNYALFPHLNVAENVAFGLKARKFSKEKIREKVAESLTFARLAGLENRRIEELSGGQQQRVAIARAIAVEPEVLLFDEPLSNLDIGLREETRDELRSLIKKLNVTAVYVTHDQEEAFTLCDRGGVLENGEILQTGTPRDIYTAPNSVAVAGFIGRNNLIRAARLSSNKEAVSEFQTLEGEHRLFADNVDKRRLGAINQIVTLAIRPENLVITFGAAFPEDNLLKAVITEINYLGATTRIKLDADGLQLEALVIRLIGLNVGDVCLVGLPPNRISVLKD